MAPDWLTVVAWTYLSVCFACAAGIACDIAFNHRRQPMGVMNAVYPITALYFGPFALAFYWRWGQVAARTAMAPMSGHRAGAPRTAVTPAGDTMLTRQDQDAHHDLGGGAQAAGADERARRGERSKPWWVVMATEVSHCGSGCSLGDVISEFVIFGLGLAIAGVVLWAEYIGDYILALALGIVFQYFAIAPMRGLGVKDGLKAATKADFISLTAFEIGLFGWMAIMAFVLFPAPHHLTPSSADVSDRRAHGEPRAAAEPGGHRPPGPGDLELLVAEARRAEAAEPS
jgi:hypothetical protein